MVRIKYTTRPLDGNIDTAHLTLSHNNSINHLREHWGIEMGYMMWGTISLMGAKKGGAFQDKSNRHWHAALMKGYSWMARVAVPNKIVLWWPVLMQISDPVAIGTSGHVFIYVISSFIRLKQTSCRRFTGKAKKTRTDI